MLGALPNHPHIVSVRCKLDLSSSQLDALSLPEKYSPACVFDFGEDSLLHTLQTAANLDRDRILLFIKQAAKALLFVHQNCLVHFDVKPSNFMHFGSLYDLKLIDFDCCRYVNEFIEETGTSILFPLYSFTTHSSIANMEVYW